MKIIDSFLFNNRYECDVLLCKLHAEYEHVDEFIGLESDYDFRGNYKGHHLLETLHSDPVFDPFLDKIFIITAKHSLLPEGDKNEKQFFKAEFASRALCWNYVQNKYENDDWLILSDVDEMLDFANPKKRKTLEEGFKDCGPGIQWQNLKFWWDFDNLNFNPDKYIPCHKIGALKERENPFWHRNNHCKRLEPEIKCGVEYAYCFNKDGNWNKVNTFAHDKYREETIDKAYIMNSWHKESQRGEHFNSPYDFFETIELNENNTTRFILENLDKLKVNTIDPGYAENRVNLLGVAPHPCETHGLLGPNKIKKECHYLRRSR